MLRPAIYAAPACDINAQTFTSCPACREHTRWAHTIRTGVCVVLLCCSLGCLCSYHRFCLVGGSICMIVPFGIAVCLTRSLDRYIASQRTRFGMCAQYNYASLRLRVSEHGPHLHGLA